MISQTGGISAYTTIDQIPRPQQQTQTVGGQPAQNPDQTGGSVSDNTNLSDRALALSKNVQQTGTSAEQQETRASEQGETREENTPTQQASPQQSPHSIDIRV